jgi:hypothetical protein
LHAPAAQQASLHGSAPRFGGVFWLGVTKGGKENEEEGVINFGDWNYCHGNDWSPLMNLEVVGIIQTVPCHL